VFFRDEKVKERSSIASRADKKRICLRKAMLLLSEIPDKNV
jgi:hypothetical protein